MFHSFLNYRVEMGGNINFPGILGKIKWNKFQEVSSVMLVA